ncbi:MAG: hypothetical protein ACFFFG_03005 [Candidatus Thorarchaeota archaeon]
MTGGTTSQLELYSMAAMGSPTELSQNLWGKVPSSYQVLKNMVINQQKSVNFDKYLDNIEELRRIVINRHKSMGTLTFEVQEALNRLDQGFLDVGHQPLMLGGPSFLANKISLSSWLGDLLGIGTFFYIGDHDAIQNELTIARVPQAKSPTGLVLTPSSWGVPEDTPMHKVPAPHLSWLEEIEHKIHENLRELMKMAMVRPDLRLLLLERFYQWYHLMFESGISAENFSHWTELIWSKLFNIQNRLDIFICPSSDLKFRTLILPGFEFLIQETNRLQYIDTLNQIHDSLISQSISPGLPVRASDYVPFFLECLQCLHKTRVELHVVTPGTLEGQCPACEENYGFSYNPDHPDLSEMASHITPRSDSRAMVNSLIFPLLVHVGGSGEVQYYSAVVPAMKRLKFDLIPITIRSNRIYYNSPWAEKSAIENKTPLLEEQTYVIFDQFNNSTDESSLQESLYQMQGLLKSKFIDETSRLDEMKSGLENHPQDQQLRQQVRRSELMLSLNYGRFTPEKSAQETSWNWLDLAVLTGTHRLCDAFMRQLKPQAFPGHTWYINPGRFS